MLPSFVFLLLSMIGVNPFLYTVDSNGNIVPIASAQQTTSQTHNTVQSYGE